MNPYNKRFAVSCIMTNGQSNCNCHLFLKIVEAFNSAQAVRDGASLARQEYPDSFVRNCIAIDCDENYVGKKQ